MTNSTDSTARFRDLHRRPPLVLPNAWDPASAVAVVGAGAQAVATTSAGVAWAAGVPDAGGLRRADVVRVVRLIAAVVDVPVTADVEDGYGRGPDDVRRTVVEVLAAGAVGVNLEDRVDGVLLDAAEQAERLAAARSAGEFVLNARTDTFLSGAEGLAETLKRAERYAEAGADVLFVPGVVDPATIRALVAGPLPLNVMAHPGAPTVAELAALGVTRISVGSAIAQAAYGLAAAATRELLGSGTYSRLEGGLGYGELNDALA
ncbi:isocitrate lyase/phosphoenolpyruvate mutase family protein [Actinosynnema sp. NPDC020468]|uniref:isocitrate lyase/PEP mutase family protein n=1 Tax=Actinosynnema sp. NPDC020468 TaxID=3154488 RepID=UPI0034052C99